MGKYLRNDFSTGWYPSADAINAPKNSLLRMDNCILDEIGSIAIRPGSVRMAGPFADVDVHSLFTVTLNGSTTRMAGATNAVYANAINIQSGVAGSGDIAFGAHMGQILFARSTTKKKYDGTTVRNWGIAPPNAAPTLTALAADSKTFATCDSTESPILTINEGALAFQPNRSGTANAAAELTPSATTGRATATKTFAAPTDFTIYDAAQVGVDADLIDFYLFITEPQYFNSIQIKIDVNDGTFQEDWYEFSFVNGDQTDVVQSAGDSLDSHYDAEGFERQRVSAGIGHPGVPIPVVSVRTDKPVSNTGWNHFSVARGTMERHGLTTGKNWSTVKAVRFVVNETAGGSISAVRVDDLKIIGGAERQLTGKFKAAIVAVNNNGVYLPKSGPSAFSSEIELKNGGIRATISSGTIAALDTQVNELWLFLFGGHTDGFYRFNILTGGPWSGAQTIDAKISDIQALIDNIRMETDNTVPPDNIIAIEGPHFDRTFVLTATHLYPSRQINPDSFSQGQAVRVGDATETALWIKKSREQLYLGTSRDIYRLDGDWTVLPDGTVNIAKRALGVTLPPISSAVTIGTVNAVDVLVYLTADGWRELQGSRLTDGAVDLLWRGEDRHGVRFVNITGATARFRLAISKNVMFCLTPEYPSTTSTTTIHAYNFSKQRWYRWIYPFALRSINADPDGTLLAGDTVGYMHSLDLATRQDDGVNIASTIWTPVDDNGQPFTLKTSEDFQLNIDTGNVAAAFAFHLDNANSPALIQSFTTSTIRNVAVIPDFQQIQLRITGSFSTILFRSWGLEYLDNPLPLIRHDTGNIDLSGDSMKWVKELRIKAKTLGTMTVTPYWDGAPGTVRTIAASAYQGYVYVLPLGREDRGRLGRVVVTTAQPSMVYWIQFRFNGTGRPLEKTISLAPDAA